MITGESWREVAIKLDAEQTGEPVEFTDYMLKHPKHPIVKNWEQHVRRPRFQQVERPQWDKGLFTSRVYFLWLFPSKNLTHLHLLLRFLPCSFLRAADR